MKTSFPHHRRQSGVLGLVLAALAFGAGGAEVEVVDPADALEALQTLNLGEYETFKKLFEQLADADFDARDEALQKIVERGPAVLSLADEYARNANAELATQARGIRGKVLLQYDQYLPTSKNLERALAQELTVHIQRGESTLDAMQRLAQEHGVSILFDQRDRPQKRLASGWLMQAPLGEILNTMAVDCGSVAMPRGDVLLITGEEVAKRLVQQRRVFDWSALELDRDGANRVGEAIRSFFPTPSVELNTGSKVLSVRGSPNSIRRAARMIALLKPDAAPAIWPAVEKDLKVEDLCTALARPASIRLSNDDPLLAFDDFRKQGHRVFAVDQGAAADRPPYPGIFHEMAPMKLTVKDMPLGLALRWYLQRARFNDQRLSSCVLKPGFGVGGRLELVVSAKGRDPLALRVGGRDISFLLPAHKQVDAESDMLLRKHLIRVLGPHWDLFPEVSVDEDLCVLRGRLLMQGSAPALVWTLQALSIWETQGRPPRCDWYERLQQRLNTEVDWDGRGLQAREVLKALRTLGGFPILMEDAQDGSVAHFRLTAEHARLLAPGKHKISALLDDLVGKVKARWRVRWGAVEIMPIVDASDKSDH